MQSFIEYVNGKHFDTNQNLIVLTYLLGSVTGLLNLQACSVYFAQKALLKEHLTQGENFDMEKEIERQIKLEHWLGSKYGFDGFLEFTGRKFQI